MSALYVLLALAFVNGDVVQTEAGDTYDSYAACASDAKASANQARERAPSKVQFVYKCVDVSQVPNAASVFGAK